jgi:homoserine O-acetyltransferase/O-succinyltransferase
MHLPKLRLATLLAAFLATAHCARAAPTPETPVPTWPNPAEADFQVTDFRFHDGTTLPTLRQHYTTLGTPHRNAQGDIDNAVMILHGTGGSGHQFLRPQFAGVLFVPGGLLDPAKYFIVLPDGIGHGKSSKPSDGLHAKFPSYNYDDMVRAHYLLLTQGLHINHLRLILGTSMGCMHSFVWGETHPDFSDTLMPLACLPVQIAGRNRLWRQMIMDGIRNDPAWQNGDYTAEPHEALRNASNILLIAGLTPLVAQSRFPQRDAADAFLTKYHEQDFKELDANDLLYQVNASRDYDPSAKLETITAKLIWINTADDFINPPELGIAEKMAPRLQHGKFVLLPISEKTHGHGTHTWAAVWKDYLAELVAQ